MHGGRRHDEGVLTENDVCEVLSRDCLCVTAIPRCATRLTRRQVDGLRSKLPALRLDVAVEVVVLGLAEMALVVNTQDVSKAFPHVQGPLEHLCPRYCKLLTTVRAHLNRFVGRDAAVKLCLVVEQVPGDLQGVAEALLDPKTFPGPHPVPAISAEKLVDVERRIGHIGSQAFHAIEPLHRRVHAARRHVLFRLGVDKHGDVGEVVVMVHDKIVVGAVFAAAVGRNVAWSGAVLLLVQNSCYSILLLKSLVPEPEGGVTLTLERKVAHTKR